MRIKHYPRWFIFFILNGLFPLFPILAQERHASPLFQYVHKIYTSDEGLPQNRSRALVQTHDGFLWIGTQDGLARFNGAVFQVYNKDNTPALKHNDITSLFETEDSTLWIGTFNGLTQLKNGIFTYHPINTGPIRGLAADHAGNLWIGTMNKGIYKYKDGKFDSITTAQGLVSNSLNTLAVDQQGNLWIAISGLGLNVYHRGQWSFYDKGNNFPSNSVRSFCVASDSTVWIGTENGLVKWKNGLFRTYTTANGLSDNIIPSLYEDRSGTLWIGTERGGICRLKDDVFTSYHSTDGLSSDYVTTILEDHEGSLWIGTFNAGLNQFWKGKFRNYTTRDGVPDRTIRAMLTAHDGSVWIGTEGGGVLHFDGKKFVPFMKNDLPSDYIRSLFEDSQGTLWIGLREGLAQYRNGKFRIYTIKDGLTQNFIRVMGKDHEGHLWVGTYNGGVNRFEKGRFVNYYDKGLPILLIRSILVDHAGAVWIGSNEGLFRWKSGVVTNYTQKDGLPIDPIFDMMEDNERTIWMGSYGGGLVKIKDNKITRYTSAQGLSNDVVLKILEDDRGNLWLGSMKGISCVNKQMLNDFSNGKIDRILCTTYSSSDGMIVSECSGPTGCKTSDGRLWFPTPKGIVVVDPKKMQKNSLPPPVVIERVVVDKVDYSPHMYAHFLPGHGQVEFDYGGMSFIAPQKVNFRYILEGFDDEWRSVGTRHGAFYTNLSPGKYVFRVTACNSDGVWNETGASFAFELEPHFYQTSWFYGLVLITFSGIVFGVYRLRVWQLLKREKDLERHVLERTVQLEAANKELEAFSYSVSHDLRAPLRSIDGFSNALLEDYAKKIDEQGKDFLQRVRTASQRMEQLIDDMLKLSRVTRSEMQRTPVNLSTLAQTIASRLQTENANHRVEFIIEPGLVIQADENLMRIMLDNLLRNAWKFTSKHPTARIELRATQQIGQKVYFVRDDGVGFDMAYANKLFGAFQRMHSSAEFEGTGIGLATVQRIIHRHGGRVWAEAAIEQGATFYFTIPR
jgi:ligand-binding sensor domain-containing protein/signal transduction histidine kinase